MRDTTQDLIRRLDKAVLDFNRGTEDLRPLLALASTALREEGDAARESAAAKVEAAGCTCHALLACCEDFDGDLVPLEPLLNGPRERLELWDGRPSHDEEGRPNIDKHDSRCPRAIARQIRDGQP